MKLCDYGCGKEAKYQLKNGKWCCQNHYAKCPFRKKISSEKQGGILVINNEKILCHNGCGQLAKYKYKNGFLYCSKYITSCQISKEKNKKGLENKWKNDTDFRNNLLEKRKEKIGTTQTKEVKLKKSKSIKKAWENKNSKYHTKEYKKLRSKITSEQVKGKNHPNYGKPSYNRWTLKKLKKEYPFFCQIEELREHPKSKKIQGHCKNHNCPNSKEKGGWFTLDYYKLRGRINALEHKDGNDGLYFYCSDKCKNECPNYNIKHDPLSNSESIYTLSEYYTFKDEVKKRNIKEYGKLTCEICGNINEKELIVHHEKPQAEQPIFSLDPDYAWILCGTNSKNKCHIKKAHNKTSNCNIGKICR